MKNKCGGSSFDVCIEIAADDPGVTDLYQQLLVAITEPPGSPLYPVSRRALLRALEATVHTWLCDCIGWHDDIEVEVSIKEESDE